MRIISLFLFLLCYFGVSPQCNVIIQPGSAQLIDVNPGIKFSFTIKNNSTVPYQNGTFHMSFGWLNNPINPDPAWSFSLTQIIPPGGTLNVTTPVFDVPLPQNATEWPFWDNLTGPNGWPNPSYGSLMLYLNSCFISSATINSFLPQSDDCPNINGDQFCDCDIEVYDFQTEPEMSMDLVIHSDYNCFVSGFPPGTNGFNSNNPGIISLNLGVKSLTQNSCGSLANNGYSFFQFDSPAIPAYELGDTITIQLDQAINYNLQTCLLDLYNSGYLDNCFEAVLWQINNSYNVLDASNSPEISPEDNIITNNSNCQTVVSVTDLSVDDLSYTVVGCDIGNPYAQMSIVVSNSGTTVINNFCVTIDFLPDGLPSNQYCFENLNLLPNQSYSVEVNGPLFSNGVTSVVISTPGDSGVSNNFLISIIDLPCYGCTLTSAINYDPFATVDDGTCIMPILGCTDPVANNFNPSANTDDGSCTYTILGCTDPVANNFNPSANTDDGSCTYTILGCTDPIANNFNPSANTDDGSCTYTILGCTDPIANNFNPSANTDDGSCTYTILGCTDPLANNFNPSANTDDGSCTYTILGCTDPLANNFNPSANTDDGSCTYTILGCTDPVANNFNPSANTDDGSCTYTILGCTDPVALNYDQNSNLNDGSCVYDPCEGFIGDLYFAPNAVTPNNDGINDGWTVVTDPDCWLEWHVFIYNRWGEMIWESRIPGQVWMGEVKQGNYYSPDGVYYYIVRGRGYRPESSFEISGHITILR
jgi:gliding motility-associated-like protein